MTERTATVSIRAARADDAEAVARVHVETWRAAYAGVIGDDYLVGLDSSRQAMNWTRQIRRPGPGGAVLVAEAATPYGPRIVGFASCGKRRSADLAYAGEVYTLYVESDWQNLGLGRALLTGCFQTLQRRGTGSAFLWVLSANPARYFYEAMGGLRLAERQEPFAGTRLSETAYGWPDLAGWLAACPN